MNERIFSLEEIELTQFLGTLNSTLNIFVSHFPELKIIARNNQVKVLGSSEAINRFADYFKKTLNFLKVHQTITKDELENILSGKTSENVRTGFGKDIILHGISGRPIKTKTKNQGKMVDLVTQKDMVFAVGPAGTGKTYTSVALAVKYLKNKHVKKVILTRPAVEAGENLGFLPGDLKEKLDPYMQPLYDALLDMIPKEKLDEYMEKRIIEIAPLAFMRGRTLNNAFVILDEAQNTTHAQMKMFLTRMGKTAKFIITGDPGQTDLVSHQKSGLTEAMVLFKNIKEIGTVLLDGSDVIRHPIVRKILEVYQQKEKS